MLAVCNSLPQLGANGRILEGILTTHNEDGTVNVAPMGPIVDESLSTLVLRPFSTSTTYRNLARTKLGVFHVTDDVELFALAALGQAPPIAFSRENPLIMSDSCRWYSFQVRSIEETQDRCHLVATTTSRGVNRDFCGFNRAKNAVIEAAILATRRHLLSKHEIADHLERLEPLVHKTGGVAEHRAFEVLRLYLNQESSLK